MNCKPGDLAVVVHTTRGEQIGRIVTCVRLLPWHFPELHGCEHAWITQPMLTNDWGPAACPDAWLRPIPSNGLTKEEVDQLYAPGPVLIPLQVKGEVH